MADYASFTDIPFHRSREVVAALGVAPFRAGQVGAWVYRKGVLDYEQMTDLPGALRAELARRLPVQILRVARREQEQSTGTRKFLLQAPGGALVESVAMRDGERLTFCLSAQVGCAMGCAFCASGLLGLERNLSAGEILDQFLLMRKDLGAPTNVVFMGMGEPLANTASVLAAVDTLNAERGIGFGARRITVSTVGLVPGIRRLAEKRAQVGLAISLHAPEDELRRELVRTADRYSLDEILAAAGAYTAATGRAPTYEYVLLAGVNDRPEQARALSRRIRAAPGKVNLIPYNPVQETPYARPSPEAVLRFAGVLRAAGVPVTVRARRGSEIDAACGQLRLRRLRSPE